MADRTRSAVRTAVIWQLLRRALDTLATETGRAGLDIVDAGGGTGGFAVPLAELGHRVTVVDPSPDALAALARRADDAGLGDRAGGRLVGVQGDTADLREVVGAGAADVVLCHGVLEYVDDPAAAVHDAAACLRRPGVLSLLTAGRDAAVLARAVGGQIGAARAALADPDGRWGPTDPVPRRFRPDDLQALLAGAGLAAAEVHGVRVFSDLVPSAVLDEPSAVSELLELEAAVADHPAFAAIASALHVLARPV